MIGKILDERYKLEKKIGSGGMADVYQAKDILLDRIVAVKILHSNFSEDNDFIVRFRHEAQSAGKLSHPNIVGIYDVGCDQSIHYIVMEYVEGQTLKQYINLHKHIPIDVAVRITIEIGAALEEAHKNGIIHCDIKPHNILLTNSGKVKVTDFGIARAVNSSTIMNRESVLGSVHYLSPEQAAGDKVTEKTDIYSLGIVFYEMLTHHLPFEGDTAVSIALKHMQNDIPKPTKFNPSISPMLEECLLIALAKDVDKRYDSVSDFISELRISQGFTMSLYKRAEPDFNTITKPILKTSLKNKSLQQKENKILKFINQIPQKYIWIGMVVLFITCFAWAFFSFGNFWSKENISVPNVVGKPVEVAEHILKDKHLRVSIDEISNNEVPSGQVISQTPQAGTNVKEQRIIHLTVSKGGAVILVPDLKGLTIEQAKDRLDKLGLMLGAIENGNDNKEESDTILSQNPAPKTKVDKGTTINIVVNMKQKMVVPSIVGMTLGDAKTSLANAKLSIGNITTQDNVSESDMNSIVISQNPPVGFTDKNKVDIVIGKAQAIRKSGNVSVSIPKTGNNRHVVIYAIDDTGTRSVYDSMVSPGDIVSTNVTGSGSVKIQVYIDNNLVQERNL